MSFSSAYFAAITEARASPTNNSSYHFDRESQSCRPFSSPFRFNCRLQLGPHTWPSEVYQAESRGFSAPQSSDRLRLSPPFRSAFRAGAGRHPIPDLTHGTWARPRRRVGPARAVTHRDMTSRRRGRRDHRPPALPPAPYPIVFILRSLQVILPLAVCPDPAISHYGSLRGDDCQPRSIALGIN